MNHAISKDYSKQEPTPSASPSLRRRKRIDANRLIRLREESQRRRPLSEAEIERMIRETGSFSVAVPLATETLVPRPEVRAWCNPEACSRCGKTWTCPPACGSLNDTERMIRRYKRGWLLVHEGRLQHERDYDAMRRTGEAHKEAVLTLYASLLGTYPDAIVLSAGSCSFCHVCTYPDKPCRFPDFAYPSMEACGLLVRDVCEQNGIPFHTGTDQKMSFVSCILLD